MKKQNKQTLTEILNKDYVSLMIIFVLGTGTIQLITFILSSLGENVHNLAYLIFAGILGGLLVWAYPVFYGIENLDTRTNILIAYFTLVPSLIAMIISFGLGIENLESPDSITIVLGITIICNMILERTVTKKIIQNEEILYKKVLVSGVVTILTIFFTVGSIYPNIFGEFLPGLNSLFLGSLIFNLVYTVRLDSRLLQNSLK